MRILRRRRIITVHIYIGDPSLSAIGDKTRFPDVSAAKRRIWNRIGNAYVRVISSSPDQGQGCRRGADPILERVQTRHFVTGYYTRQCGALDKPCLALPSRRRFLSKAPITRLNAPSSPRSLLHTYYASFVRDRHATPSSLDGGIYDGIGKRRLRMLLVSRYYRRIEARLYVFCLPLELGTLERKM